jgi:hypothetical protein
VNLQNGTGVQIDWAYSHFFKNYVERENNQTTNRVRSPVPGTGMDSPDLKTAGEK